MLWAPQLTHTTRQSATEGDGPRAGGPNVWGVRAHAQGNDEKAHGSQRLAPGLTLMAGSAHWLRSVVGWRSVLIASSWQNGVARESTSLHFFCPF